MAATDPEAPEVAEPEEPEKPLLCSRCGSETHLAGSVACVYTRG